MISRLAFTAIALGIRIGALRMFAASGKARAGPGSSAPGFGSGSGRSL